MDKVFKDLAFILVGCLLFAVPFVSQNLAVLADVENSSRSNSRQDNSGEENPLLIQIDSENRIHLDGGVIVFESIEDFEIGICQLDSLFTGRRICFLGSRTTTNQVEVKLFDALSAAGHTTISFASLLQ